LSSIFATIASSSGGNSTPSDASFKVGVAPDKCCIIVDMTESPTNGGVIGDNFNYRLATIC
jgi:hypothetical protein